MQHIDYPIGGLEAERLEALDRLKILSSANDAIMDRVCKLASEMFSVPIAFVSLIGKDDQWFKARVGIEEESTPRDVAFCNHTILSDDLLVVPETHEDERFSANPLVTAGHRIRFYAGAPLALDPGIRLGAFCLVDQKPRTFSERERGWLRDLAAILVGQLELQRTRVAAEERAQILFVAEERLRLAVEATGLGTWDLSGPEHPLELSGAARAMMGLTESGPVSLPSFLARVHRQDRRRIKALVLRGVVPGEQAAQSGFRVVTEPAGEQRWIMMSGRAFRTAQGVRTAGTFQDVTERDRESRALAQSEKRLHLALYGGRAVASERLLSSGWVTRSDNSWDVLGIGSGPFADYLKRIHADDRARVETFRPVDLNSDPVEFRYFPPGRDMMWLAGRGVIEADELGRDRLVGLTFDITARKAAEDEVWRAANHDALTGLPNRTLFLHCLEQALRDAEGTGREVSLVFLDLDDFKDVNDTLGHHAGDLLLVRTAAILREHVVPGETIGRLGGDEFAITLISPGTTSLAVGRAQAILSALRTRSLEQAGALRSRASIGIVTFPTHDRDASELMKDADLALYRAKSDGRDRVVAYTSEIRLRRERSFALVQDVGNALALDQIEPFYQPKVHLRTGAVTGFEALARWRHPTRGILTPAAFGEVFTDPEIARRIGSVMMRKAALDLRGWLDRGLACGRMAVNLSTADFAVSDLAERTLATLDECGLAPENLEVEVTETVFLGRSSDRVLIELNALHGRGVTVALDDFGTGFASLTHLKQFPVDNVKIDQSFVSGLGRATDDEAIVSAVIGLGQSLNVQVTAEGIETPEQADFLKRHGCDHAQGFFYAKPMSADRVPLFLEDWADRQNGLRGAA